MRTNLSNSSNKRRGRYQPMSEINVTPFVDVMLVLLIVFMVAAPLLTSGVTVDLPETEAKNVSGQDEPIAITVDVNGAIYLQETKVSLDELLPRLIAITDSNPDLRIFIRGDKDVDYGTVIDVMSLVNASGFNKIALITTPKVAK